MFLYVYAQTVQRMFVCVRKLCKGCLSMCANCAKDVYVGMCANCVNVCAKDVCVGVRAQKVLVGFIFKIVFSFFWIDNGLKEKAFDSNEDFM